MRIILRIVLSAWIVLFLAGCGSANFTSKEYRDSHLALFEEQKGNLGSQKMLLAGETVRLDSSLKNHDSQLVINLHLNNITIIVNQMIKENMMYFSHMINNAKSRDLILDMLGQLSTMAYENEEHGSKIADAVAQKDYDLARKDLEELSARLMGRIEMMEIGVEKYLELCGKKQDKNES